MRVELGMQLTPTSASFSKRFVARPASLRFIPFANPPGQSPLGSRTVIQIRAARHSPQTYSSLVLKEIERFKPFTIFLYADQPIYSFHPGIRLIPDLAVVMLKRLWSGEITNAKITEEMEAVKPKLILLANDTRVMPFKHLHQTVYRLVYQDSLHRLYALKAIANKAQY